MWRITHFVRKVHLLNWFWFFCHLSHVTVFSWMEWWRCNILRYFSFWMRRLCSRSQHTLAMNKSMRYFYYLFKTEFRSDYQRVILNIANHWGIWHTLLGICSWAIPGSPCRPIGYFCLYLVYKVDIYLFQLWTCIECRNGGCR